MLWALTDAERNMESLLERVGALLEPGRIVFALLAVVCFLADLVLFAPGELSSLLSVQAALWATMLSLLGFVYGPSASKRPEGLIGKYYLIIWPALFLVIVYQILSLFLSWVQHVAS